MRISGALQALLDPLEQFEAIRRRAARLGARLCDLSYANPYQGMQDDARDALREALDEERLLSMQYAPFGGQTVSRRLVADALRRSHGLDFLYRDVILTPGAMSALHIALRASVGEGDEVIVPTPCWLDYPLYIRHLGATPVTVPPDRDAELDVEAVVSAVTARTRALILAHPANPTGRNYDEELVLRLAQAVSARARGAAITVIADETHRDFTAPGSYYSLARAYPRTIIVYSFGKYHFMQGQRLGYAAVSPHHPDRDELDVELERWTRITGIATPTALMQRVIPRLLAINYEQGWLDRARAQVIQRLRNAGYRVVDADATLFVYAETPLGFTDWEFTSRLASRGVLVLPSAVFHHEGWFRLALTGSESMLERALAVLEEEVTACPI